MIQKYFNKKDLIAIRNACTEAEKSTSGEIRVSILSKRNKNQKNLSLEELAIQEFHDLKMHETRDKTGILLFLLLKEKQFQILADEGINQKVAPETWQRQTEILTEYFKNKNHTEGVVTLIQNMGKILTDYFPVKKDDTNELSNDVVIR
ncbi:MAG: TPM domain-containing protein [Candidatus Marinimicrobia bacterium]|nr:TPM domain-containing protein [Candidatus Neomarinimicrobiota bacterium]